MNKGKYIFIAMLIAISICFAENQQVPKDTIYDTITVKYTVIDTTHRLNCDSLTIEALKNSQAFYNSAFEKIQSSYNIFLIVIGILITIMFGTNFWSWLKMKSNDKELKKQIENQNKIFKLSKDSTFREIAINYLLSLNKEPKNDTDIIDTFYKIGLYYSVLHRNKVELNEDDFKWFRFETEFIRTFIDKSFELSKIDFFLYSLSEIMEYCKETKKGDHLEKLNETRKLLFDKFGREEVLTAIQKSREWRAQMD